MVPKQIIIESIANIGVYMLKLQMMENHVKHFKTGF